MHLAPCHYCGLPPYTVSHRKKDQAFVYTGIDRVDNEKGYTPDNVVPCCGVCNFMKGKLGLEQFLAQIKRIHTFLAL
jgi:5-methylcytosine-specific restriction endonuclease McrA